jgi:hypothetical protein
VSAPNKHPQIQIAETRLQDRRKRLQQLKTLKAPGFLVSRELHLCREAKCQLELVYVLFGDQC